MSRPRKGYAESEAYVYVCKCPVCKSEFCPTPQWGWRDYNGRAYCRYTCMRTVEMKKKAGKKYQKVLAELNDSRVEMIKRHEKPAAIRAVSETYLQKYKEAYGEN